MATYVDYLLAVMPIAAAHLAIPPLSFFRGERLRDVQLQTFFDYIYSLFPEDLLSAYFVQSLMYNSANWPNIDSTIITHMFVHGNYEHLLGNLSAALQGSFPIYQEFGALGLYFLFISGGTIASFPSFLHDDQKRAFSKLFYDEVALQPRGNSFTRWIPGGIRNIWNMTAARSVASIMGGALPTVSCGSSGAISALGGCTLTLLLRDCFYTISEILSEENERDKFKTFSPSSGRTTIDRNGDIIRGTSTSSFTFKGMMHVTKRTIEKLFRIAYRGGAATFWKMLGIYGIVHNCSRDLGVIYPSYSGFGQKTFWEKASNLQSVGHAAHLQGALYGAAYGCLFGIIIPSLKRHNCI